MQGKAIKSIAIYGLHQYLNIDLNFNEGVNVIYGKNGKGKTTVLHIIANILELDFKRFQYLQFDYIRLNNYDGDFLEILKNDRGIVIFFNGLSVGANFDENKFPKLSEQESESISSAFGGRPVYLPAYRSILERVKSNNLDSTNSKEYESIKAAEMKALTRSSQSRYYWHSQEAKSAHVARKTVQCREWFGEFVPTIRYPGLAEVIETLSEEFLEAQNEASQSERRMLSSMFVDVFKSLVSTQDTPSDWEIEPLIERVKKSLSIEDDGNKNRPDLIGISLAEEIAKAKSFSSSNESAAQKRVLKLYADMLELRNEEKMVAFHKIRTFEAAVNLFLDGKRLRVSEFVRGLSNNWREYAFIEADNGNCYPLSTLSSGERQILTMLFSATRMSASEKGIFLIDEPELSLHVDWQRIILTELNAQAPSRQIIACTHSPEVGADHDSSVQLFSPYLSPKIKAGHVRDGSDYMDEML